MLRAVVLVVVLFVVWGVGGAGATAPGPNGRIVYSAPYDGNSDLFSINPDGTDEKRLTWTFGLEQLPAWSPDGSRIAYTAPGDNGGTRIWVMNADGSDQHQLSPALPGGHGTSDSDPAWSPDGRQVAFDSTRLGSTWNLWVINADGTGLHLVSLVFATNPSWAPDGSRLAYNGLIGIAVIGADGSNPHLITGAGSPTSAPSWSPDGTRIVFSRNDAFGHPGELYVIAPDGSGEQQLTNDGQENALPSFSPDGTQIVFQRMNPQLDTQLYVVNSDGTNEHPLVSWHGGHAPDWGTSQTSPVVSPPADPMIDIEGPTSWDFYLQNQFVPVLYFCKSVVSEIVSCTGDSPPLGPLDTTVAGSRTFTVRATDVEGRTTTKTVTYFVTDGTPPKIEVRAPADGGFYQLNSAVPADYSCSDPGGSGIQGCIGDRQIGAPIDTGTSGSHTFSVQAIDNSGNRTTKTVTYTVAGLPSVVVSTPSNGALYALNSSINAVYSCTDNSGQGIRSCVGDAGNGAPLDTSTPGVHTFTVTATDNGSATSTRTVSYTVVGPPIVAITAPAGGPYLVGSSMPVDYSCTSTVPALGALTCTAAVPAGGALDTGTVGAKTFTVTATDALNLTTSRTVAYLVVYRFRGFDSPVSSTGVLDGAKAGEPVPLRFSLGGNRGTTVVTVVTWQQVSCSDGTPTGQTTTGTGSLGYAASADRYLESAPTDKSWKGTCRLVTIQLDDTTTHQALVRFAG